MEIRLKKGSRNPLHLQIAEQVREGILKGAIPEGGRLPPSRRLARALGVNRSTVVQAYNQLWSEGLVEGHVGRGTVVRGATRPARKRIGPPSWDLLLSSRPEALEREVQDLVRLFARENVISLAAGLPPQEFYPVDALREAAGEILAGEKRGLLQWCPVEGALPFRRHLAERVGGSSPSEIMVLTGSTQGIYLLTDIFVEPGDAVVVQSPTYLGALQIFRGAGARVVGVPSEEGGMDLDLLEGVLSRTRPKFLYVIPTFQNPAGGTMTLDERKALLELAYRFRVPVVEDDPYSPLRYEGEPVPSLKALDTQDHVIYLSSFSKMLIPGLRIGWLAAPRRVVERLAAAKHLADLFTDSLSQTVVDHFCRSGLLEEHLKRVRAVYAERREKMIGALRRYAPGIRFVKPEGGFFIWGRLPAGVGARPLLRQALSRGVSFVTGDIFYPDERGRDRIRINFATQPPELAEEGIKRLGRALRAEQKSGAKEKEEEIALKPIV